ncbi:MAG TPA: sodium:calcium antiporter [Candidatus Binatia bacterium]|nr:sodium:calcium antiporter [Candidatus Binatia bacterium]
MLLWLQFVMVTAIIVYAGSKLSVYGDVIAEKTGLGRTWVGVVMMATVTSLPELITGASSVALYDLPNIAIGNVLGACLFNLLIIALLDAVSGATPISAKAHQGQVLAAGFGTLMLGIAAIGAGAGRLFPAAGWVGVYSIALLLTYGIAMRVVFLFERKRVAELIRESAEAARYEKITLNKALLCYALDAALVIAAAAYLPHLADEIAVVTGLGQTFVGSIFVAIVTTLPELVVSVAAVKIDAADLMFGNVLGSNMFNVCILALDDLLYLKGPLLAEAATAHLVMANAAMAMTAVAIIGLTYRVSKKRLLFAWDSWSLLSIYLFTVSLVYFLR